jgi:hypothetical protein
MQNMNTVVATDTIPFLTSQKVAPMDTLWGKHGENIYLRTQSLRPVVVCHSGFEGKSVHSGLFSYNVSSGIFLLIAFLYAFLFPRATKILKDGVHVIFLKRAGRNSLFEEEFKAVEVRFRILLVFLGVFGLTVFLYPHVEPMIPNGDSFTSLIVLSSIFLGIVVFLGLKWLLFRLLEYVFFFSDKQALQFRSAYFSVILGLGLCFLPLGTAQSFVSVGLSTSFDLIILILCGIFVFLILYKIIQLFWNWGDSIFYILLYLCTLEILPVLVGLQVLKQLSFVLQIK